MSGWFKLHRKLLASPFWLETKPFDAPRAWIDMIGLCRFDVTEMYTLSSGNPVKLGRGDMCWSVKGLADRWGVDRRTVNRWLDMFEEAEMITRCHKNDTLVLHLCNFDVYQMSRECHDDVTPMRAKRAQTKKKNKKQEEEVTPCSPPFEKGDTEALFVSRQNGRRS